MAKEQTNLNIVKLSSMNVVRLNELSPATADQATEALREIV